jgi:hypothetical protein
MAVRQLWLFLTDADVAALVAEAERREPGVRASWGRYLRGDPALLRSEPARLERRESLPAERRLYLFHERHSVDLVVHEQPEGPFAGWSQIDEERSDCLVLHLPEGPPGAPSSDGAPLELRPARLQANVVTWRGADKIRKRPQFSSWAGKVIKALLQIHTPSAVPFMRLGADALARAQAGTVRLTYLYRPIGHAPVPRAAPQPVPPSAITEENLALDDEAAEEQAAAGLVLLQKRGTPAAAEDALPTASSPPASPGPASPWQPSPAQASEAPAAQASSPALPSPASPPADGPAGGSPPGSSDDPPT